jgi:hypothetical protein
MAEETPTDDVVALVQLVPAEAEVTGSGTIAYTMNAFDKYGNFLKTIDADIEPESDLPGATADGNTLTIPEATVEQGGHVIAKYGELVAKARIRVFPRLPWKWDFEGYADRQTPATWVFGRKVGAADVDGTTALTNKPGPGKPSVYVWMGLPEMKDYTVQSDVLMREEKRRLPSVGVTVQRYNLILKGNNGKLAIQSWPPHLRMAKEMRFRSDPDVWYTMKLKVEIRDDGAHVLGKVWDREEEEPAEWTIEAVDPSPNTSGSPGLYIYSLAPSAFDNVIVSQN